ncbi:MAG: hypothetical protein RLN81_03815 [Balneolaceae bacterium]
MLNKLNSFYIFIFVLFTSLLLINNRYFKGSSSFLGVTYAKEYKITSEKDAIIIDAYVVPGQTVQLGDLLLELESPELTLEIEKLRKEIGLMNSEKQEKEKLLESELQLFQSEKKIIQGDIDSDIQLLEKEMNLNRSLTEEILEGKTNNISNDSLSVFQLEINSIRQKGLLKLEAIDIQILDKKQDHQFDQSQIQARIDLAEQELEWKLQEKDNLNKYATFSGVIENVYVKQGEHIEAFSSLVSINPVHPSSVVGYLVGKKERDKTLGEEVIVRSLEHPGIEIKGRIIGFGSIVAVPEVLQKSTTVKAFGLEVFIEISEENNFPVGEKIIVK